MADNNVKLKSNDSIENFLLAADLEQFQAAFQSQGVIKVEHIIDVAKEDLIKIGLREIQIRRFGRQWDSVKDSFRSESINIHSSTDGIRSFLAFADLCEFEDNFLAEGVTKISHLIDVTADDLAGIGFTGLQIKRFQRLCKDDKSIESQNENNGLKAPMTCSTPWQDKKFGYVPHAKTERAKFLNESVLPSFYKSQWKWSENARGFTQKFHSEGRRQYDLHVQLNKLQESLSSLIEELSEEPLKPNDLKAIIYRIEQIKHLGEKVDQCKEVIRQNDEKCFTKSGKVKSGYECSHSFNEKCYSDITSLKNKIVDALSRMHSQKEKHIRMYPGTKQSSTSKKRRQKENRAKSKKRRLERHEENCKRVFKLITLSTVRCCYGDTIDKPQLNLASLSKLKKSDFHWLKLLMEKMFTTSAISIIQSTISPTLVLALENNSDSGTSEYSDEYCDDDNDDR